METQAGLDALLKQELVLLNPSNPDKASVLQELVGAVSRLVPGLEPKELLYAVSQREKMGPMPLGKGLAFCHARTEKVPELTIALAVCPRGVADFVPPDGLLVRVVLLFLIPKRHSDLYLRTMSLLLRQLTRAEVMEQVLAAGRPEEAIAALGSESVYPDLETVSALFAAGKDGEGEPIREVLKRTPVPYLAELIEDLAPEDRTRFLLKLEPNRAAAILERVRLIPAAAAVRRMLPEEAARMLGHVNIAQAADILQQLRPQEQSAILKHLGVRAGKGVQAILKYPPSTAGGIMTPDVMSVAETATIAEAASVVASFPDKRQTDLYVVSSEGRLLGKCPIRELFNARPETRVSEIMQRSPESVQPEQDREVARHLVARTDLQSIPVVGPHGAIMGVITEDDILAVVEEEASEDLFRMVGESQIVDPLHTPIQMRIRMRLPWLLLTLGGELFIALVISKIFRPTLEKAVVLAAFIPAIMATGGNVGLQSTTMVIRSLGMGTLKPKHTLRLVIGEMKLGLLTGLGCGLIAALVAGLINWHYQEVLKVSLSVFLAMVSATLATSLVGTLEPIVLHRLKLDPATACGPFVTMFNDIFGSIVYLLIAMLMNFSPT